MLKLLKPAPLSLPGTTAVQSSTENLNKALQAFQSSLNSDQQKELQAIKAVPDARTVLQFTAQLDEENSKRKSRCVASRILTLLESVQQFSSVAETFVSSNPKIAALVWGSVKLVLQIASNYSTYFEKLSILFMNIGKRCPRYAEYQVLYVSSTDLQKALCDSYSVVIRCCEQAVKVIQRPGYLQLLKSVTGSFDSDFRGFDSEVERCSKEVKESIRLAEAQSDDHERRLQAIERDEARKHRASGLAFRAQTKQSMADWATRMQLEKQRSQERRLLDQLSSYGYKTAFKRACLQRHGNTGQWLTQTPEFVQWVAGGNFDVLWCTGKLGSGKTILTAYAVRHLLKIHNPAQQHIAYFFCQHDTETSLQAETILSSLIRQCLDLESIAPDIKSCLEEMLRDGRPDLQDLEVLFEKALASTGRTYIIVDGLDECSDRELRLLLHILRSTISASPSKLKLLLAGRDRITDVVLTTFSSVHVANTHCAKADKDLKILIQQLVASRKDNGELHVGNDDLYTEIQTSLIEGAQGMILWATFQIEDICSQTSDHDIREALKNLPKDLPTTYNRLLLRISQEDKTKVVTNILRWIATVKRPLSPQELREAIAIEPYQPYSKPEAMINDPIGLVRWCHGLVTLDEEDEVLQFTHSTVKSFLCDHDVEVLSGFDFWLEEANVQIGKICVTYLNFNDFKTELIKQPKIPAKLQPLAMADKAIERGSPKILSKTVRKAFFRKTPLNSVDTALLSAHVRANNTIPEVRLAGHPFLDYASKFWLHHTNSVSETDKQTWNMWVSLVKETPDHVSIPWKNDALASCDGELIELILDLQHNPLLHLLSSSATPWTMAQMKPVLLLAARKDRLRFITPLLDWQDMPLDDWLVISAGGKFPEMLEALLDPALHLDLGDRKDSRALHVAARRGNNALLHMLLAAGADPNNQDHEGRTALHAVVKRDNEIAVKALIAAGADINARDKAGVAACHIAAESSSMTLLACLVSAGADVNVQTEDGRTPLHLAMENESCSEQTRMAAIERLIVAGADVNLRQADGRSAFQRAAASLNIEMIDRFLLEKVDVNAQTKDGRTPLYLAVENKFFDQNKTTAIERLVAAGAEIDIQSIDGLDAFHAAVLLGDAKTVTLLLAAGADTETRTADGQTALSLTLRTYRRSERFRHLEMIQLLIDSGANVNAIVEGPEPDSYTPLIHEAARWNATAVIPRFVAAGADVNARDSTGRTILHRIDLRSVARNVQVLLEAGANLCIADYEGVTAMQRVEEVIPTLRSHNRFPSVDREKALDIMRAAAASGGILNVQSDVDAV